VREFTRLGQILSERAGRRRQGSIGLDLGKLAVAAEGVRHLDDGDLGLRQIG
jgi:hypothetical protein